MRRHRLLGVLGLLMLLPACSESASEPKSPLTVKRTAAFHLTFDELVTEGEARSFTAEDEWPAAEIVETEPGAVQVVEDMTGDNGAVGFPARCDDEAACSRGYVALPDDDRLDPAGKDFSYGARVRLAPDQTDAGSNIVQKGRYGASGGQWKLQVDGENARPSCVLQGQIGASRETARLVANRGIADDEWHTVTCTVQDAKLTITVDDTAKSERIDVGTIDNDAEVRIGASGIEATDDQFHGAIDDVSFCLDMCCWKSRPKLGGTDCPRHERASDAVAD
jgi:hypothetical protein